MTLNDQLREIVGISCELELDLGMDAPPAVYAETMRCHVDLNDLVDGVMKMPRKEATHED